MHRIKLVIGPACSLASWRSNGPRLEEAGGKQTSRRHPSEGGEPENLIKRLYSQCELQFSLMNKLSMKSENIKFHSLKIVAL